MSCDRQHHSNATGLRIRVSGTRGCGSVSKLNGLEMPVMALNRYWLPVSPSFASSRALFFPFFVFRLGFLLSRAFSVGMTARLTFRAMDQVKDNTLSTVEEDPQGLSQLEQLDKAENVAPDQFDEKYRTTRMEIWAYYSCVNCWSPGTKRN